MIKFEKRKCIDLVPYANNARINDAAVEAVANSIRDFGMNNPILIDEKNVVIAGHARLLALEKLGIEETPVLVLSGISEEKIKAYRIADNSTAQLSEWDFLKLQAELDSIDLEMEQYGLQEQLEEIQRRIDEDLAAAIDEDNVPDIDEGNEPITNFGDMWRLGRHVLLCGDATQQKDVERLMEGKKADLLVTDPPYNVDYRGKTKDGLTIVNDDMNEEKYFDFLKSSLLAANSVLKPGAPYYLWHADTKGLTVRSVCDAIGWKVRQCLIWVKNSMVIGRQDYQWRHEPCLYGWTEGAAHYFAKDRTQTTVLEFDKPVKNDQHPTMKPVDLIKRLIINSCRSKGTVLDLFGGSGSTLIACERLNRDCYTMEIDPKYCDVIIKRWETLTGLKAEKVVGQGDAELDHRLYQDG